MREALHLTQVLSRIPLAEPSLVFQVCSDQDSPEMESTGLRSLPLIFGVQRQAGLLAEKCRNPGFCAGGIVQRIAEICWA